MIEKSFKCDYKSLLIDVLNQSCQVKYADGKIYMSDMGLSAYESALQELAEDGVVEYIECGKNKGLYLLKKDR